MGKIEVSPTAIASLASQAVLECYGVVGMATKDLASGIVEILAPASHRRGVDINIEDGCIVIDLYVVIEYGTPIATIARNIQSVVKYTVERAMSEQVDAVNVHVQDLRVGGD
ncbi:MAG: Asp23/Gls24 family envelope stress response protein [Anaerolineae bacterium]